MGARVEIVLEPGEAPTVVGLGERDELQAWLRRDERARELVVAATALAQQRQALQWRLRLHAAQERLLSL